MPIYEYYCLDCGSRFDMLRAMKDADTPVACVHCNGGQTVRQLAVLFASGGKSADGSFQTSSGGGGGCAGCQASSCAGCGH